MFIRIETTSGIPITRQIADQIRAQCAGGALSAGQRLPSVRALARELAVNQNTILHVYEQLTMEGLLERRHGDGTYVALELPAGRLKAQLQLLQHQAGQLASQAAALGVEPRELHELIDQAIEAARTRAGKSKGKPQ
jgi:GntR family transcriptional regulator